MFPERPRRPGPPPPHMIFTRPMREQPPKKKSAAMPNLIARFRNPEGQFDMDKITETAFQINKLYSEVSPMISKLKNSVKK
ncbi:YppG family protein [Virgibacillus sp. W0181]|uniref:YppG family protein n=1 Tax=Virgibacillus sp. W0181 TaxID=3391581 RepID=UPI003F45DDBB